MDCIGRKKKIYNGLCVGSGRRFVQGDGAYRIMRCLRIRFFPLARGFEDTCRVWVIAMCRKGCLGCVLLMEVRVRTSCKS
jgi:hypothetical protein